MVLEGEYLVSLTWIPVQFTQSVIPIEAHYLSCVRR